MSKLQTFTFRTAQEKFIDWSLNDSLAKFTSGVWFEHERDVMLIFADIFLRNFLLFH